MSDDSDVLAIVSAGARLAKRCHPLFEGKGERVQACAIADLTMTWLMGFHHKDGAEATYKYRLEILDRHLEGLRALLVETLQ